MGKLSEKQFYISVSDGRGGVVSYDNEPTWDLDNAMTFATVQDAERWIENNKSEWVSKWYGVYGSLEKMTVCEKID